MFARAYEGFSSEVQSLRSFLKTTHSMRGLLATGLEALEPNFIEFSLSEIRESAPDNLSWKVMEHTLIVGRLYALYENFIETALAEWIGFLTGSLRFKDLPARISERYPQGFSTIVSMLPSPRFSKLNTKDLVSGYHDALRNKRSYYLYAECLTYHKNNLRWEDLSEIIRNCGLEDFPEWVSAIEPFSDGSIPKGGRNTEFIASKLRDFVQYRNDGSHGAVRPDEILGYDQLVELIDFVDFFCRSFNEYLKNKYIEVLKVKKRIRSVGVVKEVFKRSDAFILESRSDLKVGQTLVWTKKGVCREAAISSIQLDGTSLWEFSSPKLKEVGLRLDSSTPVVGARIYTAI